jgi:Gas vesicle protein G
MGGMKFVFQTIADLADQELYDPSVVHEQLMLLQMQLEDGEIDEAEYVAREAELMARLREIRARNEEQRATLPAEADSGARRGVVVETPFEDE